MRKNVSYVSFGGFRRGCTDVWPRITPRSLRLTCAIHSAVQCRRQLWATARLWETLPVDPRPSATRRPSESCAAPGNSDESTDRHVSTGWFHNRACLYMYIICRLYTVYCSYVCVCPIISRYGVCIKTTSDFFTALARSIAIERSPSDRVSARARTLGSIYTSICQGSSCFGLILITRMH